MLSQQRSVSQTSIYREEYASEQRTRHVGSNFNPMRVGKCVWVPIVCLVHYTPCASQVCLGAGPLSTCLVPLHGSVGREGAP